MFFQLFSFFNNNNNNNSIAKCPNEKHLRIVLDSKLNFNSHVDQKN